jgi:biotin carboxylase
MLNAAGYRTGPAHTELRLTPAGPRIIESQARLGGDRIPRLVELATGIDIERAVFAALAGRAPGAPTRSDVAWIHYFALPPGVLCSVGRARRDPRAAVRRRAVLSVRLHPSLRVRIGVGFVNRWSTR